MARRLLLVLAIAVVTHPVLAARPNILFILSDDHRWDGLAAAGNPNIITPSLDRLARTGVHFVQATMHVPQCTPARAQLLTGLSPHQSGWYSNQYQRADVRRNDGFNRYAMLPQLLRKGGYQTVLTGKWHVRPDPWNCGFSDVRSWMPGGGGPYRNPELARGNSRQTKTVEGFTQQIFADDVIDFLESPAARLAPFFAWVAFTAPHDPFQPNPADIQALYADKTAEQLFPPGFTGSGQARNWHNYYEAITMLDRQVGRILDALERQKLDGETIIVFAGDNGFMMGNRGWDGKVLPYEDSIRVPLIIRAPGVAKFQGPTDACASSLDLPPTLLRLAGLSAPGNWTGRDLRPALQNQTNHSIDHAFTEWADNASKRFGPHACRVIRTTRHKLIRWEDPARGEELYDLEKDPRETSNRIDDTVLQSIREKLRRRLDAWMKRTSDPFGKGRLVGVEVETPR